MEHFGEGSALATAGIDSNSKFLTAFAFIRGGYGLRISVVGCMELTEFMEPESFVRGFIDYRDEVVAVIDPRILSESQTTPITGQTCLVIIEPKVGSQAKKMAVVVEDLSEVLNIASYKMDESDDSRRNSNIDFVLKLGRESDLFELVRSIGHSLESHQIEEHCYNC